MATLPNQSFPLLHRSQPRTSPTTERVDWRLNGKTSPRRISPGDGNLETIPLSGDRQLFTVETSTE